LLFQGEVILIDVLMCECLSYATLWAFNSRVLHLLGDPAEALIQISVWDGTINRLPDGWPVLVHASPHIACTRAELACVCARYGHIPFYDDALVRQDGVLDADALGPVLKQFLATLERREKIQRRRFEQKKVP
jgi:hypothetical protein